MPNNFSSIGFAAESQEDFDAIISKVLDDENIDQCDTPKGIYLRWKQKDEFGPEVFFQIVDDQIVSVAPFFRGKSEVITGITTQVDIPETTPLDAFLHGWASPETDDPESGTYPYVFEMMSLFAYDELELPSMNAMSVCAIAREIDVFESEEDYDKAQDGEEVAMASESFIPSGLFAPELEDDEDEDAEEDFMPAPLAIFTGRILETKEMENRLTGNKFHWALVKTLGGTFDVVIDPEYVEEPLKKDGILSGSFYLTADFK